MLSDRYRSLNVSLAGGQGRIELFEDTFLQRKVAIKTIAGAVNQKRLADEISALGAIRSKNVVQVYDVLVLNNDGANEPALVLEYIEGDDFYALARKESPLNYRTKCLYQLASAIADIHRFGVVHRDINPNNIKIDNEGTVKVFDFGLARDFDNARTNGTVGTPGFIAPELVTSSGETVFFDKAVDVYAFAATAYYVLTKSLYLPDTSLLDGMSSEIASILRASLSSEAEQRPPIADVVSAFAAALLKGKHQARIVASGTIGILNATSARVNIDGGMMGGCGIVYDGVHFKVIDLRGDVYLNNISLSNGSLITESCLITIGAAHHGARRLFVTFDVAHPEVTL